MRPLQRFTIALVLAALGVLATFGTIELADRIAGEGGHAPTITVECTCPSFDELVTGGASL